MRLVKLIVVFIFLAKLDVVAQSLPVGTPLEDYYRRTQLMGAIDTNVSFTLRPINPYYINKGIQPFNPDSSKYNEIHAENSWISKKGKMRVNLLPLNFQTQVNTDHPYGWNDGAMVPSKGLQTLISMGVFAKYGILSVQFSPEVVLAANSKFETFNKNQYDVVFARYYDIYNNIDLPVRFGTSAYARIFWGQSSLRLNFKSVSVGLSTENLWWGPGIRNSLLMSNTAPGFKHFTLNTLRPLKTAIGSFEGQVIAGSLSNSGFPPLEPDNKYFGTDLYVPKPNNWRYLSGVIITWQPKWVPGLFLGFDQSSQMYGKNLNGLKDYLPFFSPVKSSTAPDAPIDQNKDRRSSLFMRWLWPHEHAEVYFEWGHNNASNDLYQSSLLPEDSRAYIFGLRKILPFNSSKDENILIGIEVTQLQETSIAKIRDGQEWYVSKSIRQGYTNNGEVLGAGVGPGANLQSVNISWIKGLKKLGLQFERYVHNNDFYFYTFGDSQNFSQHWVDLSIATSGEWNYKNLIFNAKIQAIKSLDYQWALKQNGNDPGFVNQLSVFNLQVQAGILYRF
ncbi:capsule assembly Wzi family protein [Mucilaginibacter sp. UYCu711]|uniref:capsule assembly Wzi family protein n=1 Tax=Mucilaginibacter sp. UYCu711 TaxID=3156339 RepID=UPI003D22D37B